MQQGPSQAGHLEPRRRIAGAGASPSAPGLGLPLNPSQAGHPQRPPRLCAAGSGGCRGRCAPRLPPPAGPGSAAPGPFPAAGPSARRRRRRALTPHGRGALGDASGTPPFCAPLCLPPPAGGSARPAVWVSRRPLPHLQHPCSASLLLSLAVKHCPLPLP